MSYKINKPVRYKIRVYVASALGILTQADHYEDFWLESTLPLKDFAHGLSQYGFSTNHGKKWIMPASILTVEVSDERPTPSLVTKVSFCRC